MFSVLKGQPLSLPLYSFVNIVWSYVFIETIIEFEKFIRATFSPENLAFQVFSIVCVCSLFSRAITFGVYL